MRDTCPECGGEGQVFESTWHQCTVYRNECCGGCGYEVMCEHCNGTGDVECEYGCDEYETNIDFNHLKQNND